MFDHVAIRVADHPASERFYRTTLGALGIEATRASAEGTEWGEFVIVTADAERPPTRNLHVGFVAPSRDHVDAFWRVGVERGYLDDGAPGERPQYTPGYYGAFLRDPDGNSAEALCHDYVQGGSHIDHLWIRVEDLDATSAFYTALMPYAGLREGRRWEAGRQFRGAGATFSLAADGVPLTQHLQLAFRAPDQEAVEAFHRTAIAAGGEDAAPPAERPESHPGCYAAYVLDPAGARVGSVCR